MIEKKTHFYSDGLRLDAAFFLPEKPDPSKPLLVINSGFTGLKHIHPARYSRGLTPRGYSCFGFDYRGFADSEGEQGRVRLEDQVRDITNAVQHVADNMAGLGNGIVLAGWGMAGGLILEASRFTPKLRGLIALNGFYDAVRVQKALRGEDGWKKFQAWLAKERSASLKSARKPDLDPFEIYPLDPVSKQYVDDVLRKAPSYDRASEAADVGFADSLLRFCPERQVDHLRETPLFIGHGDKNALHPVEEARSLHEKYPGPKELYWIPNAGHTEWLLDENPIYRALVDRIAGWLSKLP
jgi:uncharacterized protein